VKLTASQSRERKILATLATAGEDYGYFNFNSLSRRTGIERRQVRIDVRRLARKGLTQYGKGLWTDEGDLAGSGYAWDIQGACVLFEKRTADGRCPHNGGIPLPAYTASLDAAMTLLGRNAIQSLSYWPFVAKGYESELCCRLTLIEVTQDGFGGKHHFRADAKTPALALTAAALRARAQQESSDADQ
jgi:hypothetical protein